MAGITIDTGALIAIERDDRSVDGYLRLSQANGRAITIPAPVVAQVWRGSRNARISNFLALAFVEPLTEELAKRIGELLGRARSADVVDGMVVLTAATRRDEIVTGDLSDIRLLADQVRGIAAVRDIARLPRLRPHPPR